MRHGAVVEQGRTADLLDHPQHPYTRLLRASIPGPGWKPERALSVAAETAVTPHALHDAGSVSETDTAPY